MKPFHLQDAMSGAPVVTRDGTSARFIAHVPEAHKNSQVLFLVRDTVFAFATDGRYHGMVEKSPLDLFMAPKKRVVWVNIYNYAGASVHNTEAEAEKFAFSYAPKRNGSRAYPLEIDE